MFDNIIKTIFSETMLSAIAIVIIITLWIIKLLVFKHFGVTEFVALIVATPVVVFINNPPLPVKILYVIFFWALVVHAVWTFVTSYQKHLVYDRELNNFLKNNEFDFFVQTNARDKIKDYSTSLLKITKLPRRDLNGLHCWKLLFDYLKVTKINKKELSLATVGEFLTQFKEANSKHVVYQCEFDMPKLESLMKDEPTPEDMESIKYRGLIQPIYYRQKLIGRNIYFYQERMKVVTDLRNALKQACIDLENAKNFAYILMSMTDQVGLYFDYTTRTYVASEAFCKYTSTHQKEYTFNQLMDMIHPDDVDSYVEQAATINSISVTKIKYRMLINDDYYNVLEDSININKDADLISIIRVLNKIDDKPLSNAPLSTKEAENIIDSLNSTDINNIINKTENILNTVVGNQDEED